MTGRRRPRRPRRNPFAPARRRRRHRPRSRPGRRAGGPEPRRERGRTAGGERAGGGGRAGGEEREGGRESGPGSRSGGLSSDERGLRGRHASGEEGGTGGCRWEPGVVGGCRWGWERGTGGGGRRPESGRSRSGQCVGGGERGKGIEGFGCVVGWRMGVGKRLAVHAGPGPVADGYAVSVVDPRAGLVSRPTREVRVRGSDRRLPPAPAAPVHRRPAVAGPDRHVRSPRRVGARGLRSAT